MYSLQAWVDLYTLKKARHVVLNIECTEVFDRISNSFKSSLPNYSCAVNLHRLSYECEEYNYKYTLCAVFESSL